MAYIVLFVTKTHHNGAFRAFILAPEPQVKPDLPSFALPFAVIRRVKDGLWEAKKPSFATH